MLQISLLLLGNSQGGRITLDLGSCSICVLKHFAIYDRCKFFIKALTQTI